MPLVERVLSATGERMSKPGNYIVKIGTPVKEIIEHCGGVVGDDVTVKMGGPMMGFELNNLEVPVIKGTNGIIAFETILKEEMTCIRCGRCADVCPMELQPLYFHKHHDDGKWGDMKEKSVKDCMECRCCEYVCSSKIPLVTKIKAGKKAIMEMERK
jgi:electron transport complex protein RnfC